MNGENEVTPQKSQRYPWLYDGLLVLLLIVGFTLRFTGIDWDEGEYLHPDERFLMFVESSIQPVQSVAEYFDTATSTLNPHNMGHNLFVYGTWPIFSVRYLLEWMGTPGSQVYQIGRPLSALASLATVLLVYLVGSRLYDRRVGLLAAAFSTFSVLDIQLSHFFKEDTFMTFFAFLTLYFAAVIATRQKDPEEPDPPDSPVTSGPAEEAPFTVAEAGTPRQIFRRDWYLFVLFGIALAMAMASKINSFPIAFVLPIAVLARVFRLPSRRQERGFLEGSLYLVLAAVVSFFTFRILQPYAFTGPGFFGLRPNQRWLDNFAELSRLASPDSIFGFPPALQWADRPIWFSLENIVRWGLGVPLGVAAFVGFIWMGWRVFRGEWKLHGVLWIWTAFYFFWQSSVFNPTMRYQLPIYPSLVIFAAWTVIELWDRGQFVRLRAGLESRLNWRQIAAVGLGVLVLGGTAIWALAFSTIYTRPVTRVAATRWIYQNVPGAINLQYQTGGGNYNQPVPYPYDHPLRSDFPFSTVFVAQVDGLVSEITLHKMTDQTANPGLETLTLTLADSGAPNQVLGSSVVVLDAPAVESGSSETATFVFDPPVPLVADQAYQVQLSLQTENQASYTVAGSALANESTWDDGLPRRMYGYDGFGGIYTGLNLEMYWADTPDKRTRFIEILNQADYVMITSSRQWASVGRLDDHYPISTAYYRALLGCPDELLIEDCYNQAEVGTYAGRLGFELIQVFDSNPTFSFLEFNDQPSEEAFTVYDHPKVFIFEKTAAFNPAELENFFTAIDLPGLAPGGQGQVEVPDKSLLLDRDRLVEQRTGGTWAALFDVDSLVNRSQVVSVVVWYLSLTLVGLLAYPLVRMAFPGLDDRGYPLARIVGMLVVSYLVWLGSSFRIPFERLWISAAIAALGVLGGAAALSQRSGLRQEWQQRRTYFLLVEALFLGLFLFGLFIRLGNPDLWHPWKGGEKPMDFSYFNAVLKSTSFPPYDPWYAGGYINYYYYGFVFVGVLVKWLGIVPAVAYNLVLPTLFAMIALGAFSLGWNLRQAAQERIAGWQVSPWFTGLAASFGMVIFGNLGIIRMIVRGYQRLAAVGATPEEVGFLTRWVWTIEGFFKALAGSSLPYGVADWYWNPSRVIPAPGDIEPITEFPFFTFLYADLHAHLIALPLTILVLAWVISLILARGRWGGFLRGLLGFLVGGLAIGALRPTNTWDFYPYLALGLVAVAYAVGANYRPRLPWFGENEASRRIAGVVGALVGMGLLALLAHVLYQPYATWYGQGYNTAGLWEGTRTPVYAYFDHWGVFLFFILTWMAWETREWMASTPLSSLRKLEPFRLMIQAGLVLVVAAVAALVLLEVRIAWLVFPLAVWAGVLLLRPGLPDSKRIVLFFVGTGLVLTMMVEVVVLQGDIGRMNTVFKFYLQSWTLFAVSAAAAFGWVLGELPQWSPNWRKLWQFVGVFLIASAALYPMLGTLARIKDRMTPDAPHTLDGMAYMAHSTYNDFGAEMDLSQDYRAIRWLQENVAGSPVIVEANTIEYHWGTRYTIYTGLPGVLGWNWHQRQQRALLPSQLVESRVSEINGFYNTASPEEALAFLQRYEVEYIILGQLEKALYSNEGLSKFEQFDGDLWRTVYQDLDTAIYQVNPAKLVSSP